MFTEVFVCANMTGTSKQSNITGGDGQLSKIWKTVDHSKSTVRLAIEFQGTIQRNEILTSKSTENVQRNQRWFSSGCS